MSSENHADFLLLKIETLWKSPSLKSAEDEMVPFVSETVFIKVFEAEDQYRIIDFKI